jgi:hypothetical protein
MSIWGWVYLFDIPTHYEKLVFVGIVVSEREHQIDTALNVSI